MASSLGHLFGKHPCLRSVQHCALCSNMLFSSLDPAVCLQHCGVLYGRHCTGQHVRLRGADSTSRYYEGARLYAPSIPTGILGCHSVSALHDRHLSIVLTMPSADVSLMRPWASKTRKLQIG